MIWCCQFSGIDARIRTAVWLRVDLNRWAKRLILLERVIGLEQKKPSISLEMLGFFTLSWLREQELRLEHSAYHEPLLFSLV